MSNWRPSHNNGAERRDMYKNNREDRCEKSNDSHRDRSQRDRSRDRDHRGSRRDHSKRDDDKQNGKKKYERSPARRENSHSRHRERIERSRSRDRRDDIGRRRNQHKQKRSSEDIKIKRESSVEWGKSNINTDKEKPNFEVSGKLTEDMNTVNGVIIKYSEPQDAKKPKRRWRLYPFKGEKALPTLYIHRQSAYLMGRDRKVADIPLDHPSCSKQHAALQYRLVPYQKEGGIEGRRIRPYIIDLESANGTFVNNVKLEPRRYHELLEKDVVRFGFSTREYVLLHEHSKDDSLDDDVPLTNAT
ncbi:smad nuclear interacting protein 1 [Polyergus mexicanus]|uniref:smad nuclear interacting protein 1 n=1 Tax=Polyergus mexicanus TaxID=615972 RepID=UPI0038B5CC6C